MIGLPASAGAHADQRTENTNAEKFQIGAPWTNLRDQRGADTDDQADGCGAHGGNPPNSRLYVTNRDVTAITIIRSRMIN